MLRAVPFYLALLAAVASADPPKVETNPATPLGTTALSANGRVNPRGQPATVWFEYGATTSYGHKSPERPLPPRLAAYHRETWDHGPAGWLGDMDGKGLAHHTVGGKSGGFVRFAEPGGFDPNHLDGIGGLHLASYFYPATHPSASGFQGYFGGGDPDLRDAKVSLAVRGNGFVANGSELLFWAQSDNVLKDQLTPNWRRANWAATGFPLTDSLKSGKWESVSYRLTNDTRHWTYAGNNLAQRRPNYAYAPLDQSLQNVSCDFFHLLAFVDPDNPPKGSIDFDEFELAYRNASRLFPGNGGKLVASPKGGDDPKTLTDGWRFGPGKAWRSAPNPTGPLEFEYAFDTPITVKVVQVHQNPEWPTKEVEVLVSADGKAWQSVLNKQLPMTSKGGPNTMFVLQRGLALPATRIKVRLLSGYKPTHWGLGEVEVFGDGPPLPTDDDWYHVNADLTGVKPRQTVHYRLMVRAAGGVTTGPDATFVVPADAKPHVVTGPSIRVAGTAATLQGRLTPMGTRTRYYFEYGSDTKYGQKAPLREAYGGLQEVPRLVAAEVTRLKPGRTYHYRLVGTNEAGTTVGEDRTFTAGK